MTKRCPWAACGQGITVAARRSPWRAGVDGQDEGDEWLSQPSFLSEAGHNSSRTPVNRARPPPQGPGPAIQECRSGRTPIVVAPRCDERQEPSLGPGLRPPLRASADRGRSCQRPPSVCGQCAGECHRSGVRPNHRFPGKDIA